MSTRDTEPFEPALDEVAFLARYRFWRPIALGVARAFTEHAPAAVHGAVRLAAIQALRWLAVVQQAQRWAQEGTGSAIPPEPEVLRSGFDDDYFIHELAGRPAPEDVLALAGEPDPGDAGQTPADLRRRLLQALDALVPLAQYRLLVPGPADPMLPESTSVLLGTHLRYTAASLQELGLPEGAPALFDPRTDRLLSLTPFLRWQPGELAGQGSLFMLRELKKSEGIFTEVDQGASRRYRRVFTGSPALVSVATATPTPIPLLPRVHFQDGQRSEPDHLVRGLMWRGVGGDLYRAVRLKDNAPVVLKTPRPDADETNRRCFAVEVACGRKVHHPRLIDYRPVSSSQVDSMAELDHLSGGSLAKMLQHRGVLDPFEALALLEPLCEALSALHDAGITHLDLQPENLLFTSAGQLRLGNFRVAVDRDAETPSCSIVDLVGTPMYVPPEQRSGQTVDPRSDFWQLGVLLSQMVVGERPQSPASVARPPHLPKALGAVIRRLLEPKASDRYETVTEVLEAFRAAVETLSPQRCIALDLEGTLLSTAYNPLPRPHLAEFTEWCFDNFDRVFIYTAVEERNAHVVLARFIRAGVLPTNFTKKIEMVSWPRGSGGVLKDLRHLRLPLHWVVLLDDMREWVVEDQRHRWVQIVPFHDSRQGDDELRTIRAELLSRF